MGWRFRKSKSFGPFRVGVSNGGLTGSVGGGGLRYHVGSGRRRRNARVDPQSSDFRLVPSSTGIIARAYRAVMLFVFWLLIAAAAIVTALLYFGR